MSNIEHLIENAIIAVEKDKTFEDFNSAERNKAMLRKVCACADEIWEIAQYMVYYKCMFCDWKQKMVFSKCMFCDKMQVEEKWENQTVSEWKEIEDRIQKEDNMNRVLFLDEKGPGGGYHDYIVRNARTGIFLKDIHFQKGPRKDPRSSIGVLDTDLLEIVRHRLNAFCEGDMKDDNTYKAMLCVEGALGFLARRTEDRKKRGVLGTMEK